MGEIEPGRMIGSRASGNHDLPGTDLKSRRQARRDPQGVGVHETCRTLQHRHLVAAVKTLPHLHLGFNYAAGS